MSTRLEKAQWLKAAGRVNGYAARLFCLERQFPEMNFLPAALRVRLLADRYNDGERTPELYKAMLAVNPRDPN